VIKRLDLRDQAAELRKMGTQAGLALAFARHAKSPIDVMRTGRR